MLPPTGIHDVLPIARDHNKHHTLMPAKLSMIMIISEVLYCRLMAKIPLSQGLFNTIKRFPSLEVIFC